jgi:hypothetical protein
MYDTVAALVREVPSSIIAAIEWTDTRKHRIEDGTVVESLRASGRDGPAFILHPDGTLKIERSLPKALTGQNAVDLTQSDVGDALDALDREVWEATGRPSRALEFGGMDPVRADYCHSLPAVDPAVVALTLRKWSRVNMKRKGLPVVGESGSVSWTKGMFRFKSYNKGRETGQDDLLGVLRVEGSAWSSRSFAVIPGLSSGHGKLVVADVLTPVAHEFVLRRFIGQLEGAMPTPEELGDVELLRSMVAFFGARRALGLLGLCAGWAMLGVASGQDLERLKLGEGTTWYRARADLKRYRDAMVALGDDPGTLEELQAHVGRMGIAA